MAKKIEKTYKNRKTQKECRRAVINDWFYPGSSYEDGESYTLGKYLLAKLREGLFILTRSQFCTIRDVLMIGITLVHAHRSGVIANMKMTEVDNAQYDAKVLIFFFLAILNALLKFELSTGFLPDRGNQEFRKV